ncbi:Conserved hypothetical protein [Shewanella piezotolerans WP3]|uniref:Uncharacterized protein n=1 Tax=Shewanella piezotolerans (strain WP3 / JCM 13877) TaxID=225849 RepID=B8CN57_SHEPW|nr:Conserved hypothetical protein [Shewanella piezotolerans WP3]
MVLEETLYQSALLWLKEEWPFSKIVFPGRSVSWEVWHMNLPV